MNTHLEKQKEEMQEQYINQVDIIIRAKEEVTTKIAELEKAYNERVGKAETNITSKIEETKTRFTTEIKQTNEKIGRLENAMEELKKKLELSADKQEILLTLMEKIEAQIE